MIKIKFTIFILLNTTIIFSQNDTVEYNADGLMRLTIGVHKSFYDKADFERFNTQT